MQTVLRVPADNAGERLDQFVVSMLGGISRSQVQRLIKDGHVRVAGVNAKANQPVNLVAKIEMLPWDNWGPMQDSYNGRTGDDFDRLIDQLAAGGVMVIPVGGFFQELKVFRKGADGNVTEKDILPVRFVPMTGEVERTPTVPEN